MTQFHQEETCTPTCTVTCAAFHQEEQKRFEEKYEGVLGYIELEHDDEFIDGVPMWRLKGSLKNDLLLSNSRAMKHTLEELRDSILTDKNYRGEVIISRINDILSDIALEE